MSSNDLSIAQAPSFTHAHIIRADGEALPSPFVIDLLSSMLCSALENRPCGVCVHCDKIRRGIHPDVTVISRLDGKKEIQVDQIREVVFGASFAPNEAERRVIVINHADEMNANAQNALLKLLEEPPRHIALLLITDSPGGLLPTVRSRCRVLDAGGESEVVPEDIKALAARYVELAFCGGEALLELSFELEQVEKSDFALLLTEIRALAAAKQRHALINNADMAELKRMREIIDITTKADAYLIRNISLLHIASMMCVFSD